ncbi:MAG: ABC transporter permease [Actinobacteria bacterium]|nr:ABC transporter permease [Actinomycetota bacterium]
MGQYIVRRLLYVVLVVLIITFLTFLIFYVMPPTDPAIAFAGKQPTPETIAEVEKQFGLDKPVIAQYGLFLKRIVLGDQYGWPGLGFSFSTRAPIREELFSRSVITLQLAIGAAVVWLLMGLPIGIVSALKRRSFTDRAAMGFALFGISAPVFWLGLMALYIFWQRLGIAPGSGFIPFSESPTGWLSHMIMPWVVLALLYAAFYARMVRGNLLETLGEDYIRTARAKGLSETKVIGKHAMRSSLTPVVTLFGIDLGTLLGGAVITETVFNLQGLGNYVVSSVIDGDLPAVLGATVLAALFVTFASLVVDIVYAYLDPRIRFA